MSELEYKRIIFRKQALLYNIVLVIICLAINIAGKQTAVWLGWTMFLDTLGTLIAASFGGIMSGIIVGYLTNLITGFSDSINLFYGFLNVIIAVLAYIFYQRDWFKKIHTIILSVLCFSVIGGCLGSIITWMLNGFNEGDGISRHLTDSIAEQGNFSLFWSQMTADFLIDLLDKTIVVILFLIIIRLVPQKVYDSFSFYEDKKNNFHPFEGDKKIKLSIRAKIFSLMLITSCLVTFTVVGVSFIFYRDAQIEKHKEISIGAVKILASYIDADRVDDYINGDTDSIDYIETKAKMKSLFENVKDLEYIYAYRIEEDACIVVFDFDTEKVKANECGEHIAFDEDFNAYRSELLRGERIPTVVSDGQYGYLITAYEPVYDSNGKCVCYMAADSSMIEIRMAIYVFIIKVFTVFFGAFVLIIAATLWMAERNIIYPINSMAGAADAFAYDSEEDRDISVNNIKDLNVKTGDELENLYHAIFKMTGDTMGYIEDINAKNEVITGMQEGLIVVLADLVESRDEGTGDHIKKTASYVRIILEELKKDGKFPEKLSEEYIKNVVSAAPLHDVGKITVSDTILNKPGRLTDEEFAIMKTHAAAGAKIIEHVIETVPYGGYLRDAIELAHYHHEWWNGKGYPDNLKGEEIPLSARVMAVADVFDALVSKRCYKDAFSFEKAMEIIREDAGIHFDPDVVNAFVNAEVKVRKIAALNTQV